MAYSFRRSDPSVQSGLRRIARSQIDAGLDELDDPALDTGRTVHQVRKRCKKLRGLVRLVRPAFPDYKAENVAFRDIGRSLSDLRERTAHLECFDALTAHFSEQVQSPAFPAIRESLVAEARTRRDADDKLEEARAALTDAADRAEVWTLEDVGEDAIRGGLEKTYSRARKTMKTARESGAADDLHEWRKRVKYHWYHARLLKRMAPDLLAPHVEAADRLSELLGDYNDLAELSDLLAEDGRDWGPPRDLEAVRALIARRREWLERDAVRLGRRLLAEKPKALGKRWMVYRAVWRETA